MEDGIKVGDGAGAISEGGAEKVGGIMPGIENRDGVNVVRIPDNIPESVVEWLLGLKDDPPAETHNIMLNMQQKLEWAMAFTVISQLGRLNRMFQFLSDAEAVIFNITDASEKDIRSAYALVSKNLNDFLEFVRKFLLQNKIGQDSQDEMGQLIHLLSSVPKPMLARLKEELKKEIGGV